MRQNTKAGFWTPQTLLTSALLLPLVISGEGQEKRPPAIKTVILRDVHALYGGQNLYLRSDGTGVCQFVFRRPGATALVEQHFTLALSRDVLHQIALLVEERHFFAIRPKRKVGLPGEARPTIFVTMASGKALAVSKWANEASPDFDALYKELNARADASRHGKPLLERDYDSHWVPKGFTLP